MHQNWIPHPTRLSGAIIELLPLELENMEALYQVASDKEIWRFYPGDWSVKNRFWEVYSLVLEQRTRGKEYPFVIYHKNRNMIIGSTRFMDINYTNRYLEIGGTWLKPEFWASAVNLDCKLVLLRYCFEELVVNRVYLKTQHDNVRSRRAIEKIGGVFEGIIRQHLLKEDGSFRSSAYYSILKEEWPTVKSALELKLKSKLEKTE